MNLSLKCPSCGAMPPGNELQGLCPACLVALASEPLGGPDDPEPAEPLSLGDYELLEEVATGGMGVVFRARQRSLNRLVALKMIRTRQLAGSAEVQRFRTEAEAAANLDHPNIVPIYEVGEHDGQHYFSMKLIEGASLAEQIERGKWRLTGENCRSLQSALAGLFAKVARAVHHAHERAVLHRDLKPSNILMDDQGEPHLTDFGLAKLIERGNDLTRSFAVMGTLGYMSPEQAAGKSRQITTSADIYSLGVILFELLTGRQPFTGDDAVEILRTVTDCDPPRPRALNPHVDPDLETICLKCLEKSPGRRYVSALELARDLERWLRHEPILARPGTARERTIKWVQRRPLRAALYAVSVAAAVIIIWLSTYASRQQRDAARAQGKVTDTVGQMEVQRSQDFFETENPAIALAHLARVLRDNPRNTAAAARLMAALTQRPFALPLWELKHDSAFRAANYSPDGRRAVTASEDGVAQIWDTSTGELLIALGQHRDAVLAARFSPDGHRVVTGSKDRTARVWNSHTGKLLNELSHAWWVRSAEFSPDGSRVLTVASNAVVVWEPGRQMIRTQQVSSTHVRFAQFSADGEQIVAGSQDGAVFIWQSKSGELVSKFTAHEKAVRSARFSPDGRHVVTASDDRTARVWDVGSGRPSTPSLTHEGPVVTARFDPSGGWLVTGSLDGTARLWNARQGSVAIEPFLHGGPVIEAVFSPNGSLLLTASDDGTVRLWEVATGRPMAEPVKHGDFVEQAQFSPDGRQFLTLTAEGAIRLWRLPAAQPLVQPLFQPDEAARFDWCPAGTTAVTVSNEWVTVCDLQTGRPLAPPRREPGIEFARVSPGGRFVAAVGTDHSVRLWTTGQRASKSLQPAEPVSQVEFSADGQRLLTIAGKIIRVRNSESGETIAGPWDDEGPVLLARFNDDGQQVVSVSGKMACVWEIRPGSAKARRFPHPAGVAWAELAPDGRRLLTASQDQTVRLWTLSGSQVAELKHAAPVRVAHFSPDGQTVVTASLGTARIWDVRNGKPLASMHHPREMNSARFSPDGQRLVTAAADQTIRVWDVATGRPLTDPIQNAAPVWDARYSACGRWVMGRSGSGPVVWEMPGAASPLPNWLPEVGEAVAGLRLNDAGLPERVESGALPRLRERLAASQETNSYAQWARWFVADPATRAVSPSAGILAEHDVSGSMRPGAE